MDAENDEYKCYSMLIHTAGKINDHIEDKKIVDKVIEHLNDPVGTGLKLNKSSRMKLKTLPRSNKREAILQFILKNIGKIRLPLLIIRMIARMSIERVTPRRFYLPCNWRQYCFQRANF